MINLIFPLVKIEDGTLSFIEKTKKRKDVNLFIGVTNSLKSKIKISQNLKNVKVVVFEDNSKKEEIINTLKDYVKKGKILFLRKPISQKELDDFVSSKSDITYLKRKSQGKFKDFFHNLSNKIIKWLFGFSPYEGDPSAIMFGEEPAEILQEASNVSYATRVNRWKGYSFSTIETDGLPEKMEYNKKSVALSLGIWIFLFLAGIAGTVVYFVFKPATFISVFIAVCGLFLLGTALFISIALASLKIKVGERYYNKAKEVEQKEQKQKKETKKGVKKNEKRKSN